MDLKPAKIDNPGNHMAVIEYSRDLWLALRDLIQAHIDQGNEDGLYHLFDADASSEEDDQDTDDDEPIVDRTSNA